MKQTLTPINSTQTISRTIVIDEAGHIRYLDHEEMRSLETSGTATRRRASYIHPTNPIKRLAFYAIRALFGETGSIAQWTRSWRGPWTVDLTISSGPILGSFRIRASAIDAEEAWLAESMTRTAQTRFN